MCVAYSHALNLSILPYMQFLFVRPGLCLRLPSDSTSRWTPLPLANGWCYQPPVTDSHPRGLVHAART